MSIEEYVKQSREEHRENFGTLEVKKDCVHYTMRRGKDYCLCCVHNHEKNGRLQCDCGVCYFYKPKE